MDWVLLDLEARPGNDSSLLLLDFSDFFFTKFVVANDWDIYQILSNGYIISIHIIYFLTLTHVSHNTSLLQVGFMQNYPAEICSHKSSIKINQWLLPGNQMALHTCVIHIALNQHLVPSETNLQLRPSRHDVSPSSLSAFISIYLQSVLDTSFDHWDCVLQQAHIKH